MRKLVIIGQIDPFESKISGTRNFVMNFLNSVDSKESILLCGYTTLKNANKQIINNVEFLPLIVYKREKARSLFPQTFNIIIKLYKNRKKILSEGNVLHIQRFDYAIPFLFPIKRGKVIVYFHGAASKGYLTGMGIKSKMKGFIYSILEQIILPKVDKIVTVSEKDEEFYKNKYPKIRNKIITIPIPVNLDKFKITHNKIDLRKRFGLNENRKIVLYVGRFSKVKGIDLIIRAFVDLNKKMPDTDLLLVGQGEQEGQLHILANELKAKNVHFLGELSHKEIPLILNSADVLVMASYTEGMPTVAVEALACGLPVVATDVGNIDSIITNEKIGILVKNRGVKEYKDNLKKALKMSNSYQEERKKVANRFSAESVARKIIKLHKEQNSIN